MKFSYVKEKFFVLFVYFLLLYALSKTGIGCVFRYFLHVPCPGCGMTTAMLQFIKGNFSEAFRLHPMFWSTPILGLYFLSEKSLLGTKRKDDIMLTLIGIGFLLSWVAKIIAFC